MRKLIKLNFLTLELIIFVIFGFFLFSEEVLADVNYAPIRVNCINEVTGAGVNGCGVEVKSTHDPNFDVYYPIIGKHTSCNCVTCKGFCSALGITGESCGTDRPDGGPCSYGSGYVYFGSSDGRAGFNCDHNQVQIKLTAPAGYTRVEASPGTYTFSNGYEYTLTWHVRPSSPPPGCTTPYYLDWPGSDGPTYKLWVSETSDINKYFLQINTTKSQKKITGLKPFTRYYAWVCNFSSGDCGKYSFIWFAKPFDTNACCTEVSSCDSFADWEDKQCTGLTTYNICGTGAKYGFDDDNCLEWGPSLSCSSGQVCSGGDCKSCSCSWENKGCGKGYCDSDEMYQEQDCSPAECFESSRCRKDSCTDWTNQGCGQGGCSSTQMYQTRSCTYDCLPETQCINHTDCTGDFTISASPPLHDVLPDFGNSYTVTIESKDNFSEPVDLSVSGLPAGASITLISQNPVTPVANGSGTSTITFDTSSDTPVGDYTLTITGTSGSLSHSTNVTLRVYDFTLSVSPGSISTSPGGGDVNYTVTIASQNSFAGPVDLTVADIPPEDNLYVIFSASGEDDITRNLIANSSHSTLVLARANPGTPDGTYKIRVKASVDTPEGSQTKTAEADLIVSTPNNPPVVNVSPAQIISGCGPPPSTAVNFPWTIYDNEDDKFTWELKVFSDGDLEQKSGGPVIGTQSAPFNGNWLFPVYETNKNNALKTGTTYQWQVRATDEHGASSSWVSGVPVEIPVSLPPDATFQCRISPGSWVDDCSTLRIYYPNKVEFRNKNTSGANLYQWDLDGNGTFEKSGDEATARKVENLYTKEGSYLINHKVTKGGISCSSTQTLQILLSIPIWREIAPY